MAKKGQKFKSYSEEVKSEVLKKHLEEYVPSSRCWKKSMGYHKRPYVIGRAS